VANPLSKYRNTNQVTTTPELIIQQTSTNPLSKYRNQTTIKPTIQTQPTEKKDWLQPTWYKKMANVPEEPFKATTLGLRVLRDLGVSIPMIASGMAQWPIQAHRQTISEGLKVQPGWGNIKEKTIIPKEYTQPTGIGYLPAYLYNLAFRPGAEVINQLATPGGPKALAKSFYQHPIVGPIGTGASLALPLLLTSPYVKGKMPLSPELAKAGLISPKVPIEPSITSRLVSKAFQKFQESPRFMKFKEFAGLLPEQKAFFEQKWQYELGRSKEMANAGRSELYQILRAYNPAEKESFILNLEMAKPKTPEAQALFEKANITIPEPTPNVAKALDLWNKHAEEGLAHMIEATGREIYKGAPRGRLLTKTALQRGRAEFKAPLIKEAKDLRAQVKVLGGISEESAKPYANLIPKNLIKKNIELQGLQFDFENLKLENIPKDHPLYDTFKSYENKVNTLKIDLKNLESDALKEAKALVEKESYNPGDPITQNNVIEAFRYYSSKSGSRGGFNPKDAWIKDWFDPEEIPIWLKDTKALMGVDEIITQMHLGEREFVTLIKEAIKNRKSPKARIEQLQNEYLDYSSYPQLLNEYFTYDNFLYELKSNIAGSLKYKPQIIAGKAVKPPLTVEEIASQLNMSIPDLVSGLRKFSEMADQFTKTAVEKMTTKFGYRVPIGKEPGAPKGEAIAEARWQPTIQSLEAKLGTKFTIEELRDLGFEEPQYYHHAFPREYKFRTRAYTGPSYRPGMWKERLGAKDYSREPMISIREYDYQLIKFKKLNEFKDNVVDLFGERLNPDNPMQAQIIRQGDLIKYGKGDVLYTTPEGLQIKVKENIVLPRTIANEFNKVFQDPGRFEMLARATWDRGTNVWRISVLALSPRWVLNNTLGNLILNTMGGVGPSGYIDAVQISSKAVKLMTEAKKVGTRLSFDDALIKLGVPEDVAQGLYRYEAGVSEAGTPITKGQRVVAGVKWLPDKVYRFNSTVESFFRTAHYFDKIGKGFSVADAIKSVNEFLFDYHKLTPIQRGVFRRLDPFWNWHKNIIRLAVTYPIKYPQRFLLLSYANKIGLEAYDDKLRAAGVNPDNVPDYYKNMFLLPWKDEEGKDFYISLRGIDPLQDIMIGPSNLHPIIKIILERAFKTNAFTGRRFTSPYTVYGQESKATPPLWRHILNQFPQFRVIEDVFRPYSTYETGEPMITKWGEPTYTKNRLLSVFAILGFKVTPRDLDEIYRNLREEERATEKRATKYEQSLELFKQKY
jgi:hypothetical protein